MSATLTSKRHTVHDLGDAIEFCFAQGWTDGLPVVPPTTDRVGRMLDGVRLDPKQEIGFVAHRAVSITAEKVAINAVMAGCKAEFMPVVVAAVEGIADPRWSYHRPGASTAGAGGRLSGQGPTAPPAPAHAGGKPLAPP